VGQKTKRKRLGFTQKKGRKLFFFSKQVLWFGALHGGVSAKAPIDLLGCKSRMERTCPIRGPPDALNQQNPVKKRRKKATGPSNTGREEGRKKELMFLQSCPIETFGSSRKEEVSPKQIQEAKNTKKSHLSSGRSNWDAVINLRPEKGRWDDLPITKQGKR